MSDDYGGWIKVEGHYAGANLGTAKWESDDEELQDELNALFPIVFRQHQGLPGEGAIRSAADHFNTEPFLSKPDFTSEADTDDLDTDVDK